ncbi:MAG: exodeoxyribonuclease VII small subunit [Ruminococcus sp.]|nr:exodeoxyribonuclease VII small subunit [Ruminococcus sp.]
MEEKSTFEQDLKELGRIVAELEKGDIPLENAVELYGLGVKLAAKCRKQLSDAQLKITEDDGTKPLE